MATDNRSLIQKANEIMVADLSAQDGTLPDFRAAQFLEKVIEQSRVMQLATVHPMKAMKEQIPAFKFGTRILHKGTEGASLPAASAGKPTWSYVELDAKLFKAFIPLTQEVLEDNVEGGRLLDHFQSAGAKAVARDIEEIAIDGDTTSADADLAVLDGLIKQATTHVVLGGGVLVSKTLLKNMLHELPNEYKQTKPDLRWLVSPNMELAYRDSLADLATPLGDRYRTEDIPVNPHGIAMETLAKIRDNIGAADTSNILLCNPKSIMFGFWRTVQFRIWEDVPAGVIYLIVSCRWDVKYSDEAGVVKMTGVKVA
jgi:hypothetical protein